MPEERKSTWVKAKWKWPLIGGLLGYLVFHPFVMIAAHIMSRAKPGSSLSLLDIITSQIRGAFAFEMLPWGLTFASFGGLFGLFYGQIRQVEEALRVSEEKFRKMATAAQDAIIMMDSKENISYWNESARRIFGYGEKEVLGMELHKLLVPERYREAYQRGLKRFRETGNGPGIGTTMELSALNKEGKEVPVELSLSSVQIQGEWQAVGIVRDISIRKQAEEARMQKEKLQGVLEMAGAACHELNQPMQAISGFSELLLRTAVGDNVLQEYARTIKEQIERMGIITKKIMKIAKYETRDYVEGTRIIDIDKASRGV